MRPIRLRFTILRMMRERAIRLHSLASARHASALKSFKAAEALYPCEIPLVELYEPSRKLMEAESDLWGPATAAKSHLARWRMFEQRMKVAMVEHPGGCYNQHSLDQIDLYVKEAEYWAAKVE